MMALLRLLAWANLALAAVNVKQLKEAPTGYDVTITYTNTSVKNVKIGALPYLTDQYRTTFTYSAQFDLDAYKPGDFAGNPADNALYEMESLGNGSFVFSRPFPSGPFQYNFLLDCENATLCTAESGKQIVDPENPPFETVPGTQSGSPFQVPYDSDLQYYPEMYLNFDYALPVAPECRGAVKGDLYYSKGAVSPKTDYHDFAVYLPAG